MNKGKILGLLLLASTCMGVRCGCSGDDPCENAPACESTVLGTLNLDQVSSSAIPFKGNENVSFVNSQGQKKQFKAEGYVSDASEKYITKILNTCGGCTEHYQKERRTLGFKSPDPNASLIYELVKNVPENGEDKPSVDPTKVGDVLRIYINYVSYAISLDAAPIKINGSNELRMHDSLILGTKTYRKVYEVYSSQNNLSPTESQGIYYTKTDGVIGYYNVNKELWYKE